MADIGLIAAASFRAVLSMLVVLLVGVTFAYFKKIDRQGLASVGQALNYLYIPAIMFYSFANGLSIDVFESAWSLIILGGVTPVLSAVVALPMMLMSKPPVWFRTWFVFGATFQNTLALPLVLVQTVCTQIDFPKLDINTGEVLVDGNNTAVMMTDFECIAKAQIYLFLNIVINNLLFWIVAYDLMPSEYDRPKHHANVAADEDENQPSPLQQQDLEDAQPPEQEELTPPSRFRAALKSCKWLILHIAGLCLRPPIIAQLLGTVVGLVPPLQEAFFSPTSYLSPITICFKIFAEASTAVTNLSMASGLGLEIFQLRSYWHMFGGDADGLSLRTTWTFVFTRMLVIPGVLFALIYACCITGVFPANRLLQIIAYLVSAMPSANMCVIVPQILGNERASGALGLLVLSQYLVALPSLLIWLSLAFYLTANV